MVAIVRYVYDRRSQPQVGVAFPLIKNDYEVIFLLQCSSQSLLGFSLPARGDGGHTTLIKHTVEYSEFKFLPQHL